MSVYHVYNYTMGLAAKMVHSMYRFIMGLCNANIDMV